MKNYYRIMPGQRGKFFEDCFNGNFIGADFIADIDLTGKLYEDWKEFNKEFILVWLRQNPEKSKIAAGLACGMLWTISKGVQIGDVVLCPNGKGEYSAGEVVENYSFHPGKILPHRRMVKWYSGAIKRTDMSDALKFATGSIGTVSDITKHTAEIERLIAGNAPPVIISTDETVEDPSAFALEKHLEDFLVANWKQTELGKNYDIYEEDGELVGQQYPSDTGPIDILAVSKDKKELLVVELKKGKASDVVIGQVQRYMGYVKEELAEDNQVVKGVIIAAEDDKRIRRALVVASNIEFFKYQVSFKLIKD
ncbi:MAG TPA: endonuclease NucS [Candidatus Wallbacteria bacterium]|nr:endonuclease NucS [Candidatus Wallbacteria bacterium]